MESYTEKLAKRFYVMQNIGWGCLLIFLMIFLIFACGILGILFS